MTAVHSLRLLLAPLALATLLAGCASPPPPPPPAPVATEPSSYVVLLSSPDGSTGQVVVRGPTGQQVLTQAQQAAALDGASPVFTVSEDKLKRDFGAAMAARPALPEPFLLYFQSGGAELTAESRALLTRILERARARTAVDLSVIGHTDTQGRADANEALGLKRASAIAELLRRQGLDAIISIESHGERNPLVPTPDETPEPRNRRVEITLR